MPESKALVPFKLLPPETDLSGATIGVGATPITDHASFAAYKSPTIRHGKRRTSIFLIYPKGEPGTGTRLLIRAHHSGHSYPILREAESDGVAVEKILRFDAKINIDHPLDMVKDGRALELNFQVDGVHPLVTADSIHAILGPLFPNHEIHITVTDSDTTTIFPPHQNATK